MPKLETSKLNRGQMTQTLSRVAAGETIELTRYGKTVALLTPPPLVAKAWAPAGARHE